MKTYTLQSPKQIAKRVVGKMFGGKGSGNYGHSGLDNVWGGSSKGGGGSGSVLQKQAKKFKTAEGFVEKVYRENKPIKKELKFTLRFFEEVMGPEDIMPGATIPLEGQSEAEYTINWLDDRKIYEILVNIGGDNILSSEGETLEEAIQKSVKNHGKPWVSRTGYKEPTAKEQVQQQLTGIWNEARKNG